MYKSFTDMSVWKIAHRLSAKVFDLSLKLPRSEDYGLTSQLRRSANSIGANIAEAFGRDSKKDKRLFYIIARGSAFETQNHLLYGKTVGYFDEKRVKELNISYKELIYELNKIIQTFSP